MAGTEPKKPQGQVNGGGTSGVCQSCGRPDEELVEVHRVYLETDDRGRMTGSRTLDEVEIWCLSCRAQYPNQPVEG
jgi:5-methylcytosine-specific restriction endonuclease McrA